MTRATASPDGHPEAPPPLPGARGPLSRAVVDVLGGRAPEVTLAEARHRADLAEPLGEDLQLALYLCYELHYRGFAGVDDDWEWNAELLRLRGDAERAFLRALRAGTREDDDVQAEFTALLTEEPGGGGLSRWLRERGEWWHMREYLAHRSLYHLKEADPHAWAIPRLAGRPKAGFVAVEYDEFGAGHPERVHARLYADLLDGAGLERGYLRYLEHAPSATLAVVNLMSLFGLHRRLLGALVGQFAAVEITSPPASRRMALALRRLGAPEACVRFYTEHVTADAVHEQVTRHEVVGGLLAQRPELARDVVFGIRAGELLEGRFAAELRDAWEHGRSSLRHPLPGTPASATPRP
ncbi:iron-containing redox enzyme family protein [Streptomyces sp. AJS327]|uniref:iron-containing redox enzyme family protein n=1 Tax=Streptomyces sp. AJS327 TaxID=2545265 RepID=UPI0015DE9F1B|nr:iron-containing redox enzyme family protein [Streptomyces sp. AJS327]MBA0052376.1 iron-containing redox enzyme family protein [Streptomyces sp. AJS327]